MLDFTSSAYFGLRHGSAALPGWPSVADSRPVALHEAAPLVRLGRVVARLQGEEDGVAGPSSLTLAMDLLGPALPGEWRVLVDAGCYPLLLWAAAQRGTPVRVAHYRPAVLAAALATLRPGERPIFVVDGFCVGCGRAAPLAAYARLLAQWGGRLLVDDTQAMGLHGPGGGGTPAHGAPYNTVLRLASLSKAFNVPLAFLSGTRADMVTFRGFSASRVYCSPPATPTVIAATRALLLNRLAGGRLRVALRAAVLMFRRACAACSVPLIPGLFPVQTVVAETGAAEIVEALAERGLLAFASRGFHDRTAKLRLIVTAAHRPSELLHAAKTLAAVLYKPEVDLYEPEGVSLGGLKPTGHYAFFDHRSTSNG